MLGGQRRLSGGGDAKFRSEGPARTSQVIGQDSEGVFKGVPSAEQREHNPGGKKWHGVFKD